MRASEFINEAKKGKIPHRTQQPSKGLHKFTDGSKWNSDYTQHRLGMALAKTDGSFVPDIEEESWVGRWKTAHPYTEVEADMLKMAYKAVNANYIDINHNDLDSEELKSTNTVSPIPDRAKLKK